MRRLQCLSAFYVPATSAAAKGFAQFWGCPPEEEQLSTMSSKAANSSKDPSGTATPLHTAPPPPPPPPSPPHPQQSTQAKIDELDHILELKSHSEFSLRQQYDAAQAELAKKDQVIQDSERARRAAEAEVEALREQIVDAQTRREVDGDEVERLSQQLLNAQATHAQLREESGRASRRVELLVQEKAALQRELNSMQATIKQAADAHRAESMKAQHQIAVLKRLREEWEGRAQFAHMRLVLLGATGAFAAAAVALDYYWRSTNDPWFDHRDPFAMYPLRFGGRTDSVSAILHSDNSRLKKLPAGDKAAGDKAAGKAAAAAEPTTASAVPATTTNSAAEHKPAAAAASSVADKATNPVTEKAPAHHPASSVTTVAKSEILATSTTTTLWLKRAVMVAVCLVVGRWLFIYALAMLAKRQHAASPPSSVAPAATAAVRQLEGMVAHLSQDMAVLRGERDAARAELHRAEAAAAASAAPTAPASTATHASTTRGGWVDLGSETA
jgi:hypothetical protein